MDGSSVDYFRDLDRLPAFDNNTMHPFSEGECSAAENGVAGQDAGRNVVQGQPPQMSHQEHEGTRQPGETSDLDMALAASLGEEDKEDDIKMDLVVGSPLDDASIESIFEQEMRRMHHNNRQGQEDEHSDEHGDNGNGGDEGNEDGEEQQQQQQQRSTFVIQQWQAIIGDKHPKPTMGTKILKESVLPLYKGSLSHYPNTVEGRESCRRLAMNTFETMLSEKYPHRPWMFAMSPLVLIHCSAKVMKEQEADETKSRVKLYMENTYRHPRESECKYGPASELGIVHFFQFKRVPPSQAAKLQEYTEKINVIVQCPALDNFRAELCECRKLVYLPDEVIRCPEFHQAIIKRKMDLLEFLWKKVKFRFADGMWTLEEMWQSCQHHGTTLPNHVDSNEPGGRSGGNGDNYNNDENNLNGRGTGGTGGPPNQSRSQLTPRKRGPGAQGPTAALDEVSSVATAPTAAHTTLSFGDVIEDDHQSKALTDSSSSPPRQGILPRFLRSTRKQTKSDATICGDNTDTFEVDICYQDFETVETIPTIISPITKEVPASIVSNRSTQAFLLSVLLLALYFWKTPLSFMEFVPFFEDTCFTGRKECLKWHQRKRLSELHSQIRSFKPMWKIRRLLRWYPDLKDMSNADGRVALHTACCYDNIDARKYLIDIKASKSAVDYFGNTPQDELVAEHCQQSRDTPEYSEKGMAADTSRISIFLFMCHDSPFSDIEAHLTKFPKDAYATDAHGRSCMHILAKKGRLDVIEKFIDKTGRHHFYKDRYGRDPLWEARENSHHNVEKYLVRVKEL